MVLANETELRLDKLKKYLPILVACPYTRIIFLAGSVAETRAHSESDIDLVVVAQHNRVWLNRFFLELAAWLAGQRRSKTKINNKFCFNMFLSDKSPLLPHQDFVGAMSYKSLKPVWSASPNKIENFWRTNSWINKFTKTNLEFPQGQTLTPRFDLGFSNTARELLENILDFSGIGFILEKISYKVQRTYLKKVFKKHGREKNEAADFFVTPNLAAYHFPVSNYSLTLKKYQSGLGGVDKPPPLKSSGEEHFYKT